MTDSFPKQVLLSFLAAAASAPGMHREIFSLCPGMMMEAAVSWHTSHFALGEPGMVLFSSALIAAPLRECFESLLSSFDRHIYSVARPCC